LIIGIDPSSPLRVKVRITHGMRDIYKIGCSLELFIVLWEPLKQCGIEVFEILLIMEVLR